MGTQPRLYADAQAMWRAHAEVLPAHPGPHRTVDAPRRGLSPDAFILDNTIATGTHEVTTAWPDEHCRSTMTAAARSKPAARSLHLQARHVRQMIR